MPIAPLAKGLIISMSILFAAGLAVYENPQVRKWVDESRRKVAFALHSLGDEVQPPRHQSRRPSDDSSTREDGSEEAVERRRKVREDLMTRARIMEERRNAKNSAPVRGKSFDDLVDQEGTLKSEAENAATTTASEKPAEDGLRNRHAEARGAALGAAMADPFSDEMHIDFSEKENEMVDSPVQESRESTVTLPAPARPQSLPIDVEAASNHPSELLVDLTPTISAASGHDELRELSAGSLQPTTYSSVHEWAQTSTASFYSPPESLAGGEGMQLDEAVSAATSRAVSEAGTGEHIGNVSDVEAMSEMGDMVGTPDTWTEVGSVVSEDEM